MVKRPRGKRLVATNYKWTEPTLNSSGVEIHSKARRIRKYFSEPIEIMAEPFITKETPIFTIGSCFALEIKRYLQEKKFNISMDDKREGELIWYNSFSILDEFRRVTGEFVQDKDDIWTLPKEGVWKGRFQDPYRRMIIESSREKLWEAIKSVDEEVREGLTKAEVIIITLGLTEVWFQPNGNAICAAPGYLDGGGSDSTFKCTTFKQNENNIIKCIEILKKINPKVKVILTVSPVPLGRTFTDQDHCIANMESKSILRAVAGEVCRKYSDTVKYFHSYELITLNLNPVRTYRGDGRHIRPEKIVEVMEEFERHFIVKMAKEKT